MLFESIEQTVGARTESIKVVKAKTTRICLEIEVIQKYSNVDDSSNDETTNTTSKTKIATFCYCDQN